MVLLLVSAFIGCNNVPNNDKLLFSVSADMQVEFAPGNLAEGGKDETIFQDLLEISEKEKISFNLLVLQCCRFAINNFKNSEPPEDQKSKKPKKTKTDN